MPIFGVIKFATAYSLTSDFTIIFKSRNYYVSTNLEGLESRSTVTSNTILYLINNKNAISKQQTALVST